ncbi:hypothetical protein KAU33_09770 [Candidatus Dependentiae bacterium]|nr:hypothetical protein [Candidatus Dependentiae bacterium]
MEKFRYLILLFSILILVTGCAPAQKGTPIKTESSNEFYVKYYYSSKVDHVIIEIKNNKLNSTCVNENKLDAHWDQNPTWTKEDLDTNEKTLTNNELEKLKNLIKNSDFFKLNDIEGVKKKGQKFEASTVTIKLDGKTKTVEYRYASGGPDMPKSLDNILGMLYNLAELGK